MKIRMLVLLCLVLFCRSAHSADTPRQVFLDLEERISHAVVTKDIPEMEQLFASDYVSVGVTGQIRSRSEILKAYSSDSLHLTASHGEDFSIRQYGSLAIVIGHVTVAGMDSGKDISGRYTFTRVYRMEGGKWRVASFQATSPR